MREKQKRLLELQTKVAKFESLKNEYIDLAKETLNQFKESERQQRKYMETGDAEKDEKCREEMRISSEAKEMYDEEIERINLKIRFYKKRIKEMLQ